MAFQVPLKLKYRQPNYRVMSDGTKYIMAGRFTSKSNNGTRKESNKARQGTGPRMKAYWGNVLR